MSKIDKGELHELFIEIKHGNNIGFNKLYERYRKLVYSIAFSILKNKDDSEDIVQKVFLKIWNMEKSKLPLNNEAGWLYTLTKNETISYLRNKKNTIDIDSIYEIVDADNEINDMIDKVEFNRLISKLNDNAKEIVSLKILTNLSFEEIAKLLNKPTGTIKWQYYKSIHTLKLLLSNLGMFIITFIIGLKATIIKKSGVQDIQSNETDKENEGTNSSSETEKIQQESNHNVDMQDRIEEKNITNNEEQIREEVQIPVDEPINNVNYFGIGILCISSIFFLFSIILLINFIKSQLKLKAKASK